MCAITMVFAEAENRSFILKSLLAQKMEEKKKEIDCEEEVTEQFSMTI